MAQRRGGALLETQFLAIVRFEGGGEEGATWLRCCWCGVEFSRQKPGFGTKHGTIFATPDSIDGRVGVTGSGKGMTEFEQVGRAAVCVRELGLCA